MAKQGLKSRKVLNEKRLDRLREAVEEEAEVRVHFLQPSLHVHRSFDLPTPGQPAQAALPLVRTPPLLSSVAEGQVLLILKRASWSAILVLLAHCRRRWRQRTQRARWATSGCGSRTWPPSTRGAAPRRSAWLPCWRVRHTAFVAPASAAIVTPTVCAGMCVSCRARSGNARPS